MTIFYGFRHNISDHSVSFSHKIETSYPVLLEISKGNIDKQTLINSETLVKDFLKYREAVTKYNKKAANKINGEKDVHGIEAQIRKKIDAAIEEAKHTYNTVHDKQADEIKHPRPYDVLACITKYDPGTFEDFCGEFGYDTDSRKAERVYHAVVEEWKNIEKLFTEEELQLLQEIQ